MTAISKKHLLWNITDVERIHVSSKYSRRPRKPLTIGMVFPLAIAKLAPWVFRTDSDDCYRHMKSACEVPPCTLYFTNSESPLNLSDQAFAICAS